MVSAVATPVDLKSGGGVGHSSDTWVMRGLARAGRHNGDHQNFEKEENYQSHVSLTRGREPVKQSADAPATGVLSATG